MVSAKLQYYYTFKVVSKDGEPLKVECHKWEEDGDVADTYIVRPENVSFIGKCNCPAYRECKHARCVNEALLDGKAQEFWRWKWSEKAGWQELRDIQPIEELMP